MRIAGLGEIGMGAGPINSRIGRSGDAQQVRTKIVDAHRAKPFRPAHHVGRLTDLHRIGDVSLGHRGLDIAEALGCAANGGKIGLGRTGKGGSGKRRQHNQP